MATFTASTAISPATSKLQWNVRFVSMPYSMLSSGAFAELSGNATKLLSAIASFYIGVNNGHLVATHSAMRRFGFNSKDSLSRGIRELIHLGFLIRTRTQHLRSPALYAVTWLPINEPPFGQTYDPGVCGGREALDLWRCYGSSPVGVAA